MQFVSRTEWGAKAPHNKTPLKKLLGLALHWEGVKLGSFDHAQCAGKVRNIQSVHMNSNKWADIAYSWLVCPHGTIYEGRGDGIRSAANGTNQANENYLAVCYLGGPGDPFTDAGKKAMSTVIAHVLAQGTVIHVRPHSDFIATQCPGPDITDWLRGSLVAAPAPLTPPASKRIVIEPRGSAPHPSGHGGWIWGERGHVYALGDATYFGGWEDETRADPKRLCVALVPTETGQGYWLVSNSGELFAYGDAQWPGNYQREWGEGEIVGAFRNARAGVDLLRDDGANLNTYSLPA